MNPYVKPLIAFIFTQLWIGSQSAHAGALWVKTARFLSPDSTQTTYIAGAIGGAQLETECNAIDALTNNSYRTGCDHNDPGVTGRINIGYQINKHLAIEAGYIDLGSSDLEFRGRSNVDNRIPAGQVFESTSLFQIRGYTLGARFSRPLSSKLKIYGKIGGFLWHSRYDATFQTPTDQFSITRLESGPDTTGGIGLRLKLSSHWSIGMGWEYYAADGEHMDLYLIDLIWRHKPS
jgi:opacity protein-like surface antigen